MKKLLFLVVSLVMTTTSVSVAQTGSTVMWGKPTYAMKGGENGKYYRIVVKSDKDRKTQIDDMTAILRKYNIVENINLDEVDDVMATFAVPFRLPLTQDVGKGPMGVPYVEPPVILSGELYFEFDDEYKTTTIRVGELENTLFIITADDKAPKNGETWEKYQEEMAALLATKNPFSKFLIWANVGLSNMKEFYAKLDDYYEERDLKYKVYEQLIKDGEAKWMTPEEYVTFLRRFNKRNLNLQADAVERYIDTNCMPAVSYNRWINSISTEIDRLFAAAIQKLGGVVCLIEEDHKELWSDEKGGVFPLEVLNPKNRETHLKK